MAFKLTESKTDDRVPVQTLTQDLVGKLVGDKGSSAPLRGNFFTIKVS